jgi:PBSX family phage terminase large subunit
MNVAEGAIRSGKTIDHCIIAAMYLEECPDKIHLASGSTIGNAKLNIGACNGFGLENLFRGRCKWGKYKDNEALYLYTQTGEKIIIFAGGAKADSYKKILGNSYGLWIATEINEHYDCDDSRSSFIKVAFGRQVAAEHPLILWDLNPCNPGHSIYTDYIDNYLNSYVGGYQYQHFTIADNLSISEQRKAEIESQYVKGSIWYRRDILGERCIAEGLVYPMYENAIEEPPKETAEDYQLSIDYGTLNAFACILWGKHKDVWYAEKEYYYSGRTEQALKTDDEYADIVDEYFGAEYNADNKLRVIIDPSAASFITALRRREKYRVIPADNAVVDGIRETASAMSQGFIKISPKLKHWKKEVEGYVWDNSCSEDRPIKDNDHCLTGDTLVMTENGEKPISELVGTSGNVWSYNTETGIAELKPYHDCRMTQISAKNIIELKIETGKKIRCTSDHLILTQNGWKQAIECVNERIITFDGNSKYVWGMSECGAEPVYNMEVADNHNFAVNGGLIVHNCMDAMRYFVKTNYIVRKAEKGRKYGEY